MYTSSAVAVWLKDVKELLRTPYQLKKAVRDTVEEQEGQRETWVNNGVMCPPLPETTVHVSLHNAGLLTT